MIFKIISKVQRFWNASVVAPRYIKATSWDAALSTERRFNQLNVCLQGGINIYLEPPLFFISKQTLHQRCNKLLFRKRRIQPVAIIEARKIASFCKGLTKLSLTKYLWQASIYGDSLNAFVLVQTFFQYGKNIVTLN